VSVWSAPAPGLVPGEPVPLGPSSVARQVLVPASAPSPVRRARAHRASPAGDLRGLVRTARAGDPQAREALLAVVLQIAHRYARARLGTYPAAAELAADVAQEVGMGVLTALPSYADHGVPFEAFVYRLASRKVADAQRAHARGPVPADHAVSPVFDSEVASAETWVVDRDEASRAWAMLETLSERHREVLVLRVGVGLSAAETADALGMTAGSVRVTQHRALTELRARWQAVAS
jgi:RNA polymerase sigma-70 factor, ECF subfamily